MGDAEVVNLYVQGRLSVAQISKKLGLTQYKVRKILNQNAVARRSISEAATSHHMTAFGREEFILKKNLSHREELLKVAGVMLYWGEGAKTGNCVGLSNSNPELIKVFLSFLRVICGVKEKRLRISIHYYKDQNPDELVRFWSKQTSIPKSQFHTPWLHDRKGGTYRTPSKYGTIILKYSDKKLLGEILKWVREYEFLGDSVRQVKG